MVWSDSSGSSFVVSDGLNHAGRVMKRRLSLAKCPSPVIFETALTAGGHSFGRVILNAPERHNLLSLDIVKSMLFQLDQWADDARFAGVVLDASGSKTFCLGSDIASLLDLAPDVPGQLSQTDAAEFFEHLYRLNHLIHSFPKPIACWGHGLVSGSGLGLLASATHRVVTPQTCICVSEAFGARYPNISASWILSRMPGRTGQFVALTGVPLNAADALFGGLADFVVPQSRYDAVMSDIASTNWSGEKEADSAQLSELLESQSSGFKWLLSPLRVHFDRIRAAVGHDRLVDAAPRLAALRSHENAWLAQAGELFLKNSPATVALVFEMLRSARWLSWADSMRLEWSASMRSCAQNEVTSGVKAREAPVCSPSQRKNSSCLLSGLEDSHPLADLSST